MAEEALVKTRILRTAVGREVPVRKMGYTELICSFATKIQSARHQSEVATRKLEDEEAKLEELEL